METLVFQTSKILDRNENDGTPSGHAIKVVSSTLSGQNLANYRKHFPNFIEVNFDYQSLEVTDILPAMGKLTHQRMAIPFPMFCGRCFHCMHQLTTNCENFKVEAVGEGKVLVKSDASSDGGRKLDYAYFGPRPIEDDITLEQEIFLNDIFPTGWATLDLVQLDGKNLGIFGCGPVGIMSRSAAWVKGMKRVIETDLLNFRLDENRGSEAGCASSMVEIREKVASTSASLSLEELAAQLSNRVKKPHFSPSLSV